MTTDHKVLCQDCGYEFGQLVEQMDNLPTRCPECGSASFELEEVDDDHWIHDERKKEEKETDLHATTIEQFEEDKRNLRD